MSFKFNLVGIFSRDNGGTANVETGKFEGNPSGIFIKSCSKISYKLNLFAGSITKILLIKSLERRLQGI